MDPVDDPQTTNRPARGPVGQECWLTKCVGEPRCFDHTPECTVWQTDGLNYQTPDGKAPPGRRRGVCGALSPRARAQ